MKAADRDVALRFAHGNVASYPEASAAILAFVPLGDAKPPRGYSVEKSEGHEGWVTLTIRDADIECCGVMTNDDASADMSIEDAKRLAWHILVTVAAMEVAP